MLRDSVHSCDVGRQNERGARGMAKKQVTTGLESATIAYQDRSGAEHRRSAGNRTRFLVVGDRAIVDSLRSVFEEPPDVVRAGSPDETFHLLRNGRADIVVVDQKILDQGEAGADPQENSSDTPIIWLALSPEGVGTLGDLLKAVAKAGQSGASLREPCQTVVEVENETH
jgi:hypothetical protein